ncbi:MAG: potassium channel family protein [bacterium]|nr:potassium channel family protein [bacterium]MDE0600417.1 potassium channel family protein [bacterium]
MKRLFFDFLALIRHPWILAIRPLLKTRRFGVITVTFLGFAAVAGLVHSLFEGTHPAEGLWWALVTLTTVGYGDVGSVTTGARIVGSLLMLTGIGALAFITANIAAFFVDSDFKKELQIELHAIHERLERIEQALADRGPSDSKD